MKGKINIQLIMICFVAIAVLVIPSVANTNDDPQPNPYYAETRGIRDPNSPLMDDGAIMVADKMDGKILNGKQYIGHCEIDQDESDTISAIDSAKVFHYSGHGGYWAFNRTNFLILLPAHEQMIHGHEIPDIDPVPGGGPQYLAFASGCSTAKRPRFPWDSLQKGFTNQGCKAYLGYRRTVLDESAFNFACSFYDYATQGYTVSYSKFYATLDVPLVYGNIRLVGDGSMRIVD